jgi:hypothetical protein
MATPAERMAKMRGRRRAASDAGIASSSSSELGQSLADSIDILRRSGLPCPTQEELATETPGDRAGAIGKILGAAAKALDLARRRGELVSGQEAQAAMMALAASVRQALERMPAYLPADLTPDVREAATSAMRQAQAQAFAALERGEDV